VSRLFTDQARYWRSPLLPGAEMLTAEYREHAFAPHWHEHYVFAVVTAGAEGYSYCGAEHVATPGTIAVINPGEVHTGSRAVEEGWAYRVFYPQVAVIAGLAEALAGCPVGAPWFPGQVVADADLAVRLARAHVLLESGADALAAETALNAAFSLLIARHARNRPLPARLTADAGRVARMQEKLAADPAEPVTLSELAASVGLSPFHAARLFARQVGMPPHAWRVQLRLNRAQELLRRGLSVTEAAAATGFTDQSHFTRHFKRAHGVAPGRWVLGGR